MEKILRKVYFDPSSPACYSGVSNVLKEAKRLNNKITLDDVKSFLEKQATYARFRPAIRKFPRLKTISYGPNTTWQADLGVMINIAKDNDGIWYFLLAIDCFTRKIYVEKVRRKSSNFMIEAYENIFKKAGAYPWALQTDDGKEHNSREILKYFKSKDIQKYSTSTHPVLHATMAERGIRTVKDRLYKYFNEKDTLRWVDVIDSIVNALNNSVNRTTGMAPNEITKKNANKIYEKLYKTTTTVKKPKFNVGDIVRIDHEKKTFTKGLARYSAELFKITEVLDYKTPVVYRICDLADEPIKGYFYEKELVKSDINSNWTVEKVLKTKKVGKETQYFVKWAGFPSTFNKWITKKDLI